MKFVKPSENTTVVDRYVKNRWRRQIGTWYQKLAEPGSCFCTECRSCIQGCCVRTAVHHYITRSYSNNRHFIINARLCVRWENACAHSLHTMTPPSQLPNHICIKSCQRTKMLCQDWLFPKHKQAMLIPMALPLNSSTAYLLSKLKKRMFSLNGLESTSLIQCFLLTPKHILGTDICLAISPVYWKD